MQYNLQNSLLTNLDIGKKSNFKKPSSWPDIRKNLTPNSIRLLADIRYPLGFIATVTGGYSVDIDGEHYGNYNSAAQFSMADWSGYTDTDGYDITYPEDATKAHIIDIYPQSADENIIKFNCSRVAESGTEEQGVLWAHFNLTNAIGLDSLFFDDNYKNTLVTAVTAKSDKITLTSIYGWSSGINRAFANSSSLEYLPSFETREGQKTYWEVFKGTKIKKIKLSQGKTSTDSYGLFEGCQQLEKILGDFTIVPTERTFLDCRNLTQFPALDATSSTNMSDFITNAKSLKDTVLDVRSATGATRIGCYAQSSDYFMSGFKGLRVSSSAPFTGGTPQINVQYTGLDRQALVTLFNDLPTVSDGQIINLTGCSGTSSLSEEDKTIATDKGWTITE